MTGFPEWLPDEYRFVRYLDSRIWREHCPYPKGSCQWCGKPLPKLRRRWCSEACSNEFQVRRGAAWIIIAEIEKRDQRRCALCGRETHGGGEIDHIIPVIEGGGCCGLENLRTLCRTCHIAETAALARRRADRRDPQLKIELPQRAAKGSTDAH